MPPKGKGKGRKAKKVVEKKERQKVVEEREEYREDRDEVEEDEEAGSDMYAV